MSCLVLDVPLEATTSLPTAPGSLDGLTVAVRWEPGIRDTADSALGPALERLTVAGARAGIAIVEQVSDRTASDSLPEGVSRARFALIDPPGGTDVATRVFSARSLITSLRAARRDIEIAVEPDAFERAGLPPDRIEPYVDTLLSRVVLPPRPTVEDLIEASQTPAGERVRAVVESPDWDAVADFVSRRATSVDVTAARRLTADEIVARYQARRRRQDSLVQSTIGHGTTTVMFEVPGFVAPVTISARTTIYARGDSVDMEHQDVRVNGASLAGGSETPPRIPLLEPERITTPPLQISLTDAYSYKLDGAAAIDGAQAYVIAFGPRAEGRGLARGRAWIDATDFRLRRLQVTQEELRGPIVSSEQVQDFVSVALEGQEIELPGRTRIYQMYEGAGHRTAIHRAIDVEQYVTNAPDFDELLQAARASSHLIVRETPAGVDVAGNGGKTIRTVVLGVLVDPNISSPLPFAGLSYVDLDVLGTGAQLNAFFGGTFGQLSWSVPSPGDSRWQIHGRAFAIAARYNDRSFLGGLEQYVENVLQRPAHVSAGVVRPLTPRLRARVDYELDITAFSRSNTTSGAFRIPATGIVHGLVTAIEGERGAWAARAWWNPARRQGWREWGLLVPLSGRPGPANFDPRERDFQRYGASLSRTLALRPALGSRLETTWVGGRDLDRFSRYIVNSFDNRVHGYPTASIRYDGGLVARSATSWTRRGWRLDGFVDLALVRDPGFGEALRGYPGVGAAVESAGPFRTLLSFEWGYGFNAVRRDGGRGTQAVRIAAYRMF